MRMVPAFGRGGKLIALGEGINARTINMALRPFTLIDFFKDEISAAPFV